MSGWRRAGWVILIFSGLALVGGLVLGYGTVPSSLLLIVSLVVGRGGRMVGMPSARHPQENDPNRR